MSDPKSIPESSSAPPSYNTLVESKHDASASDESDSRQSDTPTVLKRRPQVFVYYQVFKPEGLVPCKKPVDPQDPYLARIEAENIPPPHTVSALMQHIVRVEGISDPQLVLAFKLFESASRSVPLDKQKHLTILDGRGPGVDPQEPLALVMCNIFEKPIVARRPCDTRQNRAWLSYSTGDILYTNGVLLRNVRRREWWDENAYRARNSNGQIGFIYPDDFLPL